VFVDSCALEAIIVMKEHQQGASFTRMRRKIRIVRRFHEPVYGNVREEVVRCPTPDTL